MSRVFISYRRDDAADATGRILDWLRKHFGPKVFFRDVDAIPLGRDFREVIAQAVEECEVLLAVIGASWLNAANDEGGRRLDDPNDFVRLEIETALKRKIPVIPVLVAKAKMPKATQLPESLQALAFRHGLEVRRDPDFERDMDRLIQGLTGLLQSSLAAVAPTTPPPKPREPVATRAVSTTLTLPGNRPMEFAWCPPGSFMMGSKKGQELVPDGLKAYFEDEQLVHKVVITRGFYMGVDPVTQAQWKAVMGTDPSYCKGPNRPVEQVSAHDADAFCAKLATLLGKAVRLPTEAEWEYACRAGTRTEFSFGDVPDPELMNYDANHVWNGSVKGTYRRQTTNVGTFPANPWGLRDMHGNVWEWCADSYDAEFYSKSPEEDPFCDYAEGYSRVLRGGSWNSDPLRCRSAGRYWSSPDDSHYHFGFRVCFNPD